VAATQPVDLRVQLSVLRSVWGDREVYATGRTALWLHGAGIRPDKLVVGVPQSSELAARAPVTVRRLSERVLAGATVRHGIRVVALEIAVIQVAAACTVDETVELVEELVRSGRTTLVRLRARCRRGLHGSANVRRACDALTGGSMDADVRRLHQALLARGVTGLEVERHFTSRSGASAYADLFHHPSRTALEVDGRLTHTSKKEFRTDRRRDRWMRRDHGVTTLRVDVGEIREDLDEVADEVAELLFELTREAAERPDAS
jgi:very-short-patch-repair endonuclease